MRKSPNPAHMSLEEVADAIDRRPSTIKKYRMNPNTHPFFRKAFKSGTGQNSPLRWWRADVEEYLREISGRGIGGAA